MKRVTAPAGIDRHTATACDTLFESLLITERVDCVVSAFAPRLFHIRDANGRREVDMVAELRDGRVVAIEIRASAARDQQTHVICAG